MRHNKTENHAPETTNAHETPFERTVRALLAVPKAEVAEIETARPKRKRLKKGAA